MFGLESRSRLEFGGSLLVSPTSFPQLPLQPKQIQGLKFISGVNSKYLGTVLLCVWEGEEWESRVLGTGCSPHCAVPRFPRVSKCCCLVCCILGWRNVCLGVDVDENSSGLGRGGVGFEKKTLSGMRD